MDKQQIPAGYKQTEVGVIPDDWAITTIGEFAPLQRGFDLPNRLRVNGIYPVVYSNGIVNFHNQFQVKGPGVVTGRSGTIGKVHFVEDNYWPHNTALWVKKFNNAYPKYVYYLYLKIGLDRFASGSGVPTLNRNDAHSFKIGVPKSLDEQTAIANALSDVDTLIAALEKLIDKKTAIKTATMQQLLTGKKRLPPFDQLDVGYKQTELGEIPRDWEVISLGSIGSTYGGLSGKSKQDFGYGQALYVPFTNVMANVRIDIDNLEKVNVNEPQNRVVRNDLLFNGSSETPEEVCFSSLINFDLNDLYLNSFCFGFRARNLDSYFPMYLAYWFRSDVGRAAVSIMAQGSTRYNISKRQFLKLCLALPSFAEQTAIANVLSDMDTELDALQQRLAKTQHIKQGMMQELLTGKTRLIHGVNV